MYYLEDKHPKVEYTLYCQVKSGKPFIGIWQGTNMQDVYRQIGEIEKKHGRHRQRFYIDNDFYNNTYTNGDYVYYYRFMQRTVNDWQTVRTKNNILKFYNPDSQIS